MNIVRDLSQANLHIRMQIIDRDNAFNGFQLSFVLYECENILAAFVTAT